jgi:hypothetical protein
MTDFSDITWPSWRFRRTQFNRWGDDQLSSDSSTAGEEDSNGDMLNNGTARQSDSGQQLQQGSASGSRSGHVHSSSAGPHGSAGSEQQLLVDAPQGTKASKPWLGKGGHSKADRANAYKRWMFNKRRPSKKMRAAAAAAEAAATAAAAAAASAAVSGLTLGGLCVTPAAAAAADGAGGAAAGPENGV